MSDNITAAFLDAVNAARVAEAKLWALADLQTTFQDIQDLRELVQHTAAEHHVHDASAAAAFVHNEGNDQ